MPFALPTFEPTRRPHLESSTQLSIISYLHLDRTFLPPAQYGTPLPIAAATCGTHKRSLPSSPDTPRPDIGSCFLALARVANILGFADGSL
ncbi:MAG: hypothetical protein Q9211_003650 [Gyalolechia sp. 1 TL-2023]